MKESNETPEIQKIDVDSKTGEPVIVSVPKNEADDLTKDLSEASPSQILEKSETDNEDDKTSEGEQLKMNTVFGMKSDDSVSKRQKLFKRIFTAVFIALIIGVLFFTAYNDFFKNPGSLPKWSDVEDIFKSCWFYAIFALIALFCCFFFKGLKLSILSKNTTKKWNFKTCMQTAIVGHYYNFVTPLAVGGQPFEIYYLNKHGVSGGASASLPIVAYFLNQFAFVLLCATALILLSFNALGLPEALTSGVPTWISIVAIIGLCISFGAPLIVVIFCTLPRLGSKLVYFVMWLGGKFKIVKKPKETTYKTIKAVVQNSRCIKKVATSPLTFISCALISFCEHLSMCSIAYFTLRFFGYDLVGVGGLQEWAQIIQMCLILYVAISIIPTPGNSGAADFSFYFLFQWGLKTGLAFTAMITWRLLSFYSFLIIGFIFLSVKKRQDKKTCFK